MRPDKRWCENCGYMNNESQYCAAFSEKRDLNTSGCYAWKNTKLPDTGNRREFPSGADIAEFRQQVEAIFADMTDLLCSKRADYGPGNIPKFGSKGVIVRLYDKIERLVSLQWGDKQAKNESIDDSWKDLIGYGVLGWMEYRKEQNK